MADGGPPPFGAGAAGQALSREDPVSGFQARWKYPLCAGDPSLLDKAGKAHVGP